MKTACLLSTGILLLGLACQVEDDDSASAGVDSATAGEDDSTSGAQTTFVTTSTVTTDGSASAGSDSDGTGGPVATTGEQATDSGDSSTTGEDVLCDPAQAESPACQALDPHAPYCLDTQTCASCSALAAIGESCTSLTGSERPACDVESGQCVECTAQDDSTCSEAEVCNLYTHECGECFEHSQCKTACNMNTGLCLPSSLSVWVEKRDFCLDQDGSQAKPFCSIFEALNAYAEVQNLVIHLKQGTGPQQGGVIVSGGRNVVILGEGENAPQITDLLAEEPLIQVSEGATLHLSYVDVIDNANTGVAVECEDGALYFDKARIAGNEIPVFAKSCQVGFDRSIITANTESSVIYDGALSLRNSFVSENSATNFGAAFRITAPVDLNYVTMLENSDVKLFSCLQDMDLKIRNSVLLNQEAAFEGKCNVSETSSFIGASSALNFLFQKPVDGVYRPQTDAKEIKNLATWEIGDPYVNFDGKPRPNAMGASDFAGAAYPYP